ncbi:MAG: DUF6632 domain-containing protein [Candidatus Korobacteraceae bacterium]
MTRERVLKGLLVVLGLLFLAAAYPLTQWNPPEAMEQMLGGVYATLGVFLLLAVRRPSANRSLIGFAAWSSIIHAAVMAVQASRNVLPRGELLTSILPLFVIGVALIVFAPVKLRVAVPDRNAPLIHSLAEKESV